MAVKGLIRGFTEKRRTSTQSSDNRLFLFLHRPYFGFSGT